MRDTDNEKATVTNIGTGQSAVPCIKQDNAASAAALDASSSDFVGGCLHNCNTHTGRQPQVITTIRTPL